MNPLNGTDQERMICSMSYDIRALANLVLEEAGESGQQITNLHINKALFFVYVDFYREFGFPPTRAKVEAWEHGPVFREVYNQFKNFGRSGISGKAMKVDYDSGKKIPAIDRITPEHEKFLRTTARFYAAVPASVLYDLSHNARGAWAQVWNHRGEFNIGMEITPELIMKYEVSSEKRIKLS